MEVIWRSSQLAKALGLEVKEVGEYEVDEYEIGGYGQVRFNSQQIQKGDIFIALKGAQRDGHDYVADALERGAGLAIVSGIVGNADSKKQLLVADTAIALQQLAAYKRATVQAKFIAITGSTGKTTTKEILKSMLETYSKTYATPASFNNYLGVPISLASIADDVEYVIIEIGMNAKNEIDHLSKIVRPDISLLIAVDEGHIGFFRSLADIACAKCEIFNHLDPDSGLAILNSDMNMFEQCLDYVHTKKIRNIHRFGKSSQDNVMLYDVVVHSDGSLTISYKIDDEIREVNRGPIPLYFIENFGAGLAVINALSLPITNDCLRAVIQFEPMIGRGRVVIGQFQGKECKIICDYYNANPKSMESSLGNLATIPNDNKVAILGSMGELGDFEHDLHMRMVKSIEDSGLKKLFLVGAPMQKIATEFSGFEVYSFDNVSDLLAVLPNYLQGGELILLKGSRSYGLEKVAQFLGVENVL